MKPNQLQAIVAVAAHQSIRSAARQLGVSQPAVTKIVRELERELGAPLVERSVKGVRLTEYGAAFAPRASQLLEDMRRARDEVAQLRDGLQGRVSLAVSTSFALTLLPPAFREFHARQPSVDVRFDEAVLPEMLKLLQEGRIDFAVTHVMPGTLAQEFEGTELFPVHLVVGMRRRHPLRHARTLQALMDAEWVLPGDGGSPDAMSSALIAPLGLPPSTRVVLGQSVTVALALVGQMDLVGLFVEPLAKLAFRRHGIVRVDIEDPLPEMRVCSVQRRGRTLTPAAEQLVACIRRHAKAHVGATSASASPRT